MPAGEAGGMRARGVGGDLRALRKARGMRLADLALRVGRSVGWLSQVERGLSEPGVDDMRRLARALDQPVSFFFGQPDAAPGERGYIVRDGRRRVLGTVADGLVEELLSPDLGGSFEVLRCVFEPGSALKEELVRPTEETGYILSGNFEIAIGGRVFRLGPGDSFRFSREPIRWRNPGTAACVIVWVIAPPVY